METATNRFPNLSPLKQALLAMEEMQARLAESERGRTEPIAIIGMGCRFPRADNPAAFWRVLHDGVDAVDEVPASRWKVDDFYDPDPDMPGKMSTRWGGFLDNVDKFDPEFFGISPREAAAMDPQQRLLLEVAWEALESAGQGPRDLVAGPTGVFVGMTSTEYAQLTQGQNDPTLFNAYFASGIARSVAGGRISYTLGIQGPNISIDTACSSSLVAVHTACLNLRMGECRMALAGGSNVILSPDFGIAFSRAHMLAGDGRCKAFDSRADGFVRSEGCGIVVLKRLSDAVADGDPILALIRGSAVNQDGRSSGLTVPNRGSQETLIAQALASARVQPHDVSYVEAHGTGTELGDPIEANALANVLGIGRPQDTPLLVGAVKTNLGHLESAAGVAGLIKVVLALQHMEIPPNLHFQQLNPNIDWGGMPIEIPVKGKPWVRGGKRRVAGVSAFGFSGTNAHVIVEEAPLQPPRKRGLERPLHILTLSARSQAALGVLGQSYAKELLRASAEPADICYTCNAGRSHFEYRLAVTGESCEELRRKIATALPGTRVHDREGIRPAFLFSGQGAQYAGMGKELYATQAVFREAIEQCGEVLKAELEEPLVEVLWGRATDRLEQTFYTQPALFAVEYALAELWKSWGIEPAAVLGHSVGEYVAACVAGVYSLADGLRLIARRGRLMQAVAGEGAMCAVQATEDRIREALRGVEERVGIAALNGPESAVISGYAKEVAMVEAGLRAEGVRVQRLAVSHGFHSPQMREMERAFAAVAGSLRYGAPQVRLISSVTGQAVGREEMSDAQYWVRQVREPVRFRDAMETLGGQGTRIYLEIGPGTTLVGLGRQCVGGEGGRWLASLKKGRGEWEQILESLGRLYVEGAEVNWAGFDAPYGRRRVALPTYPFERQRHWIESTPKTPPAKSAGHTLLGRRTEVAGAPKMYVWETRVSTEDSPYLADHRAFGRMIYPLTCYLEMMIAAAAEAGSCPVQLQDIVIYEPLILSPGESKTLQILLKGDLLEAYSRENSAWKKHAAAQIAPQQPPAGHAPLADLQKRMPGISDGEEFYREIRGRGMDFGPAFRTVQEVRSGNAESLVRVARQGGSEKDLAGCGIHPALLDGCFQGLKAALPAEDGELYLPVRLDSFAQYKNAGRQLWTHARRRTASQSPAEPCFDFTLFDETGLVAEARGLHMRAARSGTFVEAASHRQECSLVELSWEAAGRAGDGPDVTGEWLILADRDGLGVRFAERLSSRGAICTVKYRPADLQAVVTSKAWRGVVHLWALDAPSTDTDLLAIGDLQESIRTVCGTALELVQSLSADPVNPPLRLWLVTNGAQSVGTGEQSISATQAALWGMAQAITEEYREWRCTCIDLEQGLPEAALGHLEAEISGGDSEQQVAFRGDTRFVARLTHKAMLPGLNQPQRLTVESRGVLSSLRMEAAERRAAPPGCVEIQVDAAGLNFRDVLNVLGMYPGESGPLGSECAGHIVALGEGVTKFEVGDDVIAMAPGTHDGFVVADARLVASKPVNLRIEEAATLPTVFLTARYTLERLAKIGAGDRILIHAASGGVGLAAVQIAQRAGAEIFATAGSEHKRAYLRSLGIRHVMNSRTLDFTQGVLGGTGGQGVDIVLNSLAGEFIPASFSVLARGGRFIEIGKREIWTHEQAAQLGKNIDYHIVDLGAVAREDPSELGRLLRDTVAAVERQELRPLPLQTFAFRDASGGYRHMAQAQHIGKVILRQDTCGARISGKATYLITGGLGGLGLQLARWLVAKGARNVVLLGRSEPPPQFQPLLEWATAQGARLVARRADVGRPNEMTRVLSEIEADMPPLRGIVHAAAVVADGALTSQSWGNFERVLHPKAIGAWVLHKLTAAIPLDFFILFSSASALLGAAGIGNYSAANAFEDALAHERRRRGMSAISINWGPWTEGLAAKEGLLERYRNSGAGAMTPEEGLALLDYILLEGPAQVTAGIFDWGRFLQRYPPGTFPRRFSKLIQSTDRLEAMAMAGRSILERLRDEPEAGRLGLLRAHVHNHALSVLGFAPNRHIDPDQPLSDLGLDSLMIVEFRNSLAKDIGQNLPATLLFSHPTISDVSSYLFKLLSSNAIEPISARSNGKDSATVLTDIEGLSDEDVDRILAERLGGAR